MDKQANAVTFKGNPVTLVGTSDTTAWSNVVLAGRKDALSGAAASSKE